jgi:hypothetical protein
MHRAALVGTITHQQDIDSNQRLHALSPLSPVYPLTAKPTTASSIDMEGRNNRTSRSHSHVSHRIFILFFFFPSCPRMMPPSRSHHHVVTVYCHYLNDFDCALHFPCGLSEDHVPPLAFPSRFSTASYLVFSTYY